MQYDTIASEAGWRTDFKSKNLQLVSARYGQKENENSKEIIH